MHGRRLFYDRYVTANFTLQYQPKFCITTIIIQYIKRQHLNPSEYHQLPTRAPQAPIYKKQNNLHFMTITKLKTTKNRKISPEIQHLMTERRELEKSTPQYKK